MNGSAVANENFLLTFPQGLSAEGSDAPGDEVKHKDLLQKLANRVKLNFIYVSQFPDLPSTF